MIKMLKEKIYFIAAIGTDIGKTFLTENLCRILPNVMAIKPIASGFRSNDKNSDPVKILTALNLKISQKNLDEIAPWRFEKAVSPHFAGKINFAEVKKFCAKKIAQAKEENKFLFIETAGGVMTPLTDKKTFLDLIAELKIPVLLVSSNYLGSISHTLCAVQALKNKKIKVEKIIINEHFLGQKKDSLANNLKVAMTIENISGIKTITLQNFLKKILIEFKR